MLGKRKQIRLSGKALAQLVKLVYERDQHKCAVCGWRIKCHEDNR